jgi:hypothetical protein
MKPEVVSNSLSVSNHPGVRRPSQMIVNPSSTQRTNPMSTTKKFEQIERATSPVDERILQEFYADQPQDMHSYKLEGRQYIVYESKTFTDIDTHRKGDTSRTNAC